MMKEGKEEEKVMGPLFPRLHVNDADKGGPRAPPRNKMALYEQLSIPSQRFSPAAATVLPLPSHHGGTLVPSASSSQGCGHERTVFSPFYLASPHTPTHSVEKVHSRSSDGVTPNMTRNESEKRSVKHVNSNTLKGTESLAECSSHRPHDLSKPNSSCMREIDDDDDFRVPTFVQSMNAACSNKGRPAMEAENLTPFHPDSPKKSSFATVDSSIPVPSSFDKPLERMNSANKKSRQNEIIHIEQRPNAVSIKEHKEKCQSLSGTGEKFAEFPKYAKALLDPECTRMVNASENLHNRGTNPCEEVCGSGAHGGQRCPNDNGLVWNGDELNMRSESCLRASPRDSHRNRSAADTCSEESDKVSGCLRLEDADRNGDVSEASMVDSLSGLEISPDDVVGVIGPKQFWKARRAIINQQRVFAVQVFELHRLIKVQKLIAASPHLLLEDYPYLGRSVPKGPAKNTLAVCNPKSQQESVKHKDDSQKVNQNQMYRTENTVGAPQLLSCEKGSDKGHCQVPGSVAYSGNPPPIPAAAENKPSAWSFHPPASQWLVPVMSPSEGLIYKPYRGPCPQAAGFMAPVYGSCGPLGLPPGYCVPTSHQQPNMGVLSAASAIAPCYFPSPYGLPVVNPIISASAVKQVSSMVGSQPHGQTDQHSRSSCNMLNSRSEAFMGCLWRFQASKESEIQGSTSSSPCERAQGEGRDALPLFPMALPAEGSTQPPQSSGGDNNQHQVIKVVPHNARSATESAARIFQSIQEERQQYDDID